MLPIVGALIGLVGSALPDLIKTFRDKQDKKHELEVLKLQMEMQRLGHTQRIEEIQGAAEIKEIESLYSYAEPKLSGVRWVDAVIQFIVSSVRPTLTYFYFGLYAYVKFALLNRGVPIEQVWTEVDTTIWTTVVTFWFGSRVFQKMLHRSNK